MPDDVRKSRALARAITHAAPRRTLVVVFAAACALSFTAAASAAAPPVGEIGPPFLAAPGDVADLDPSRPRAAAAQAATVGVAARRSGVASMMRLVNSMRRQRGLRRIRTSGRIAGAAHAYAVDMARRGFFSHVAPGGATPADRLARVGYSRVRVGEVIAWGCGGLGRPSAILRSWINSPPHYQILTDPSWRVAGVGAASGVPGGACGGGRTWAMSFAGGR